MTCEHDYELELLRDSVRRFASAHYGAEQLRALRGAPAAQTTPDWAAYGDNGWIGAAFAESHGGSGNSLATLGVIARELGHGLSPQPFIAHVAAGLAIERLGTPDQLQHLPPLAAGTRRAAIAWSGPPPWACTGSADAALPRARRQGNSWRLDGRLPAVPGAGVADLLLVPALLLKADAHADVQADAQAPIAWLLLPAATPGLRVLALRTLDGHGAADLLFDALSLPAEALLGGAPQGLDTLHSLHDAATALACADTVGAMARAFGTTLDYLKQRIQFGKPLGSNQALQHRLVDLHVLLGESEALTRQALGTLEGGDARARAAAVSTAALHVFATARRVGHEAIQMHGGIGTTDEALISHAFKRLVAARLQWGHEAWHRERLSALLGHDAGSGAAPSVDVDAAAAQGLLGEAELAFCEQVRDFIRDNLDSATRATVAAGRHPHKQDYVRWEQALARQGWLAYTWPAEHGGPGWSVLQQYLFEQVLAEMDAPTVIPFGMKMVGPVLLRFGTEAQQREHLPGVLNATRWWCQGYSEPGAGSDLAALSTRAERDGEHYVVNGQKIWTSTAQWADWMFALVRTSRESRRQDGISFLLIDMRTPGIEVRPIISLDGHHGVNEVFFTDVRVPVANRIGEEGQGWTCAKYLLEHERLEVVSLPQILQALRHLRTAALTPAPGGARPVDEPGFRARLIDAEVRTRAIEARVMELLGRMMAGSSPGPEVSGLKIRGTELSQDILELALEAAGPHALPYDFAACGAPLRPWAGAPDGAQGAASAYLYRRAWTILGGSTEVQKNILSKAVLGL